MKKSAVEAAKLHAIREYPRESCGVVIVRKGRQRYIPCRNMGADVREGFSINAEDMINAEHQGEIVGIVHSHPDGSPEPSDADRVACEVHGVEWLILNVGVVDGQVVCGKTKSIKPAGFELGYVGRNFHYGTVDCQTLVLDWYAREMGINLAKVESEFGWWNKGQNLYVENYTKQGFVPVSGEPRVGDLVLMQIRSPVANHAGIYVGDGCILHHLMDRLSSRDLYDGYFQEVTVGIARHKDAYND